MSGDLSLPAVWNWDQKPTESTADFPPKFRAGTSPEFIDKFGVYLCGQPNYNQWNSLLNSEYFNNNSEIYIFDLRAELRLLVNGQYAISYTLRRPVADICLVEEFFAEQLRNKTSLKLSSIIKAPKALVAEGTHAERAITEEIIEVEIESVLTEQQAIHKIFALHPRNKNKRLHYLRLPINNHDVPSDGVIDDLLTFMMYTYTSDLGILLHCEGGKGRSSLVLEMLKRLYCYKFGVKPADNCDTTSLAKIGRHHSQEDIEQGRVSPSTKSRSIFLTSFASYSNMHFHAKKLWTEIHPRALEAGLAAEEVVDVTAADDANRGQHPDIAKLGI